MKNEKMVHSLLINDLNTEFFHLKKEKNEALQALKIYE